MQRETAPRATAAEPVSLHPEACSVCMSASCAHWQVSCPCPQGPSYSAVYVRGPLPYNEYCGMPQNSITRRLCRETTSTALLRGRRRAGDMMRQKRASAINSACRPARKCCTLPRVSLRQAPASPSPQPYWERCGAPRPGPPYSEYCGMPQFSQAVPMPGYQPAQRCRSAGGVYTTGSTCASGAWAATSNGTLCTACAARGSGPKPHALDPR
jgi:hypothetical protein